MNIWMLLFKDIHYDARVQREAEALAGAGHLVTIACLKEFDHEPPVLHENIVLERISIRTKRYKRGLTKQEGKVAQRRAVPRWMSSLLVAFVRFPLIKLIKDVLSSREYYVKVRKLIQQRRRQHLEQKQQQQKPDVIHCHDLNTLPQGTALARRFGAKLVYDSHELYNEMAGKNPLERKMGYVIEKFLIKKIDHLIVVNTYVAEKFTEQYGKYPVTIVQNTPVLPEESELGEEQENYWRKTYNLAETDRILLFQGGLTAERGLEECIQALAELPREYKFILLGEGRIKGKLEELADELNVRDRVYFHPQVSPEGILWYTKQADIGLVIYKNTCANNYFSTPNKVFEYMFAGIPTIASDHPGKSYVVEKNETGLCVPETPQAIKGAVEYVSKHYDKYRDNALDKRAQLCWQQEKKGLVRMYQGWENKLVQKVI